MIQILFKLTNFGPSCILYEYIIVWSNIEWLTAIFSTLFFIFVIIVHDQYGPEAPKSTQRVSIIEVSSHYIQKIMNNVTRKTNYDKYYKIKNRRSRIIKVTAWLKNTLITWRSQGHNMTPCCTTTSWKYSIIFFRWNI